MHSLVKYIYIYIDRQMVDICVCVCVCALARVCTYVHTLLSIYMSKMSGRDHENLATN